MSTANVIEGVYTTEECPSCATVFNRYIRTLPLPSDDRKKTGDWCPTCGHVVYLVIKRHLGVTEIPKLT